jgi:hypothetical protein
MRTWQTPGVPGAAPETRRPVFTATVRDTSSPAVAVLTSNPSDR